MNRKVSNTVPLYTQDLQIGYQSGKRHRTVLDRINLSMERGELVCLLGENGVGKSTLLKTISKIIKPLSGDVFINGKSISKLSNIEIAQNISLVLTERINTGMMTVYDLVSLGRYPYTNWSGKLSKEDWKKVDWAIDQANIAALSNLNAMELSDGQLQKVMIARALAQDGEIMILDEPTAFLDINNRLEIINLLKSLAKETNKAILISTHELDLALFSADKLWLATCCLPIVVGIPEDLVLKNALQETFDHDNFNFDLQTGRFAVKRAFHQTIGLEGPEPYFTWTKHALNRMGYAVVDNDETMNIKITKSGNDYEWKVNRLQDHLKFDSIESLLKGLNSVINK
ncbi:ABC transporter ATP-binding protein [Fulvivirgaceae bacterium BMA10]|uniref:ABC transporter ATP-binding protein n=1 Tax=Splendidivirga corallicola TaxID=3051826 RepID=A0ABT8KLC7_9BACT|nr:ABC transporter ATP-binding protein [Fulvivirgaceae bacterium BMA10]